MGIKLFESEEEAKEARQKLEEDMAICTEEKTKKYTSLDINWDELCESWKEVKRKTLDRIVLPEEDRLFFIAHTKDKIEGKPQLIHQTIQRIPLVRKIIKTKENKDGKQDFITVYKFIDDRFDRRYDGKEQLTLAFDFWVYRIIDNGKEHYIFSRERLSEEYSEFYGMKINLDDLTEISSSLKVKKIASIFILKESKPAIKVLDPVKLVEFCKGLQEKYGWDYDRFQDFVFTHTDGKIYNYSPDFNKLRIAQLLSSKYEGYPLHLLKMGPVGTGKTTEAEVLDYKFKEYHGILEAGNSTMKVLVPSFKEKPANLGYVCNCNRVSIIDELMKMIEATLSKTHDDTRVTNYLGQLNMLLEHKKRTVGSGNDNSTVVQATAKVCITTNNLSGKSTIYSHVGVVDNTTLSRMLIWIQDNEETDKIYQKTGIKPYFTREHSRTHSPHPPEPRRFSTSHSPSPQISKDCVCGEFTQEFNDFLTIYDSCQQFLINFSEEEIKRIFAETLAIAKKPMTQIWKARGLHHIVLVLDGLVKYRCLFRDYDPNFAPTEEDYDLLEHILVHMVKTWDTNFDGDS